MTREKGRDTLSPSVKRRIAELREADSGFGYGNAKPTHLPEDRGYNNTSYEPHHISDEAPFSPWN